MVMEVLTYLVGLFTMVVSQLYPPAICDYIIYALLGCSPALQIFDPQQPHTEILAVLAGRQDFSCTITHQLFPFYISLYIRRAAISLAGLMCIQPHLSRMRNVLQLTTGTQPATSTCQPAIQTPAQLQCIASEETLLCWELPP